MPAMPVSAVTGVCAIGSNAESYVRTRARIISLAQLVAPQRFHVRNNRDLQPSDDTEVLSHIRASTFSIGFQRACGRDRRQLLK